MKRSFLCLGFLIVLLISSFGFPSVYALPDTETLRPNAVGDNSELTPVGDTPNWKCVDEATSDGDTTYVRSSITDELFYLDLYNIDASAIPAGSTINSVTVYAMIRSIHATGKALFLIALKKSGGSVQLVAVASPSTTYVLNSASFNGITQVDLDALQIGVQIASTDYLGTYRQGRCTQVYVVIDYTPVAAEYNFYGSASLIYITSSSKTVSFNRYGTSTLTFTSVGTFLKSQILNFLGSATLTFTSAISKALVFNRYGTSPLTFGINSEKAFSFGRWGTSTLTFIVDTLKTVTFNRYGTSIFTFTATHEKLWSLTRHGTSALTFLVESFQNIISAKTLNFFGSADLHFITDLLRTFTVNRYGTALLTFIVQSLVEGLGRYLTFFGSAVFTFTIIGQTVGLEVMDLISLALCILALAFSVYPLVECEEKALPAVALVFAIVGMAFSVLGLWFALPIAALSFILSVAAIATKKD